MAMGDLRNWQDQHPVDVVISGDCLTLSHDAVAALSSVSAEALGLPPTVDLVLKTDVTGVIGQSGFRLHYEWSRNGLREAPHRQGAILGSGSAARRVPLWMKRALDLADGFDAGQPIDAHWQVLADFRRTLDPEETETAEGETPEYPVRAGLAMTAFLRGLKVSIADRFSIAPDGTNGQFEVVPYSSRSLARSDVAQDDVSEGDAELKGETLAVFQDRLSRRGARPAYQLGNNAYLVIDPGAAPVLAEMARVQKAPRETRQAFIANPRIFITEAVNRHLAERGAFKDLDDAGQEEMVEAIAGPAFIESREYSERVTGKIVYRKPGMEIDGSGTTWLPEVFDANQTEYIRSLPNAELQALRDAMAQAVAAGSAEPILIDDIPVAPSDARLAAIEGEIDRRSAIGDATPAEPDPASNDDAQAGPVILDTLDNYQDLSWLAQFRPRPSTHAPNIPSMIRTPLHTHQKEGFDWALRAWTDGLPGILNADEQGLGKTLQTLAFLAWVKEHMANPDAAQRGPLLIVAPTSLLRNWEREVDIHLERRGLGTLIRLYGSALSGQKQQNARGNETDSGLPLLDLEWLDEAIEEGRAHRYWFLTTYTTLANYQHSLGKVNFSVMVMDEVQAIKNRNTLASKATEAMQADFRIGLTGTPIENSAMDLWTIMDRIAPGCLGAGSDFRTLYAVPNAENMAALHSRVFHSLDSHPPLGLRRLKDEVAQDLPSKTRFLHPRFMPVEQARVYDEAQRKLATSGPGGALRVLHHIRSVSVHPAAAKLLPPDDFIGLSGRLQATMEILDRIHTVGERALVFIEHREMQFRFAELVRHRYGLRQIDVINGSTPIPRRQNIVDRFQDHLDQDQGFDLLILGPRAAGTGLTLTAATHVIHLSRWWNPAVEEQCNDRVHRIGQRHPVQVHVPMAVHPQLGAQSFDCLLQSLMQRKRRLAEQALWPMGDTDSDFQELAEAVGVDHKAANPASIAAVMAEMFLRDGVETSQRGADGSWRMQ